MAEIDSAIVAAKRKAHGYQYVDGLPTLAMSLWALLMGSAAFLGHWISPAWGPLAAAVVCGVCLFIMLPDAPIMQWLKSRITYPRTGFVVLSQASSTETPQLSRKIKIFRSAALAAFLLSTVFLSFLKPNAWLGAAGMTAVTIPLCFAYRDEPRFRTVWLLIPSIWLSTWCDTVMPIGSSGVYFWLILGLLSLIMGITQLLRYVLQHRVAHE